MDRFLQLGDSGCLVLDREHREEPPHLMYLGETVLDGRGAVGYGLLLEQPRRILNLEFFSSAN
jgi:hypothetical protein